MKKTIKVIALLLAMLMILSACGTPEYSKGLDENGYFSGVKASDYITITDMDKIIISQADIDSDIYQLTMVEFPNDDPEEIMDRAVTEEDEVNIDYVGSIDGEEFEGGNSNGSGTDLDIDNSSFITGFAEQIVGHMPGEVFDINVTFPEDYDKEELAGKDAVFEITLNYIIKHNYSQAEFNDEFVQTNLYYYYYYYFGVELTTADQYVEMLKQSLEQTYLDEHCSLVEEAEIPDNVQTWINDTTLLNLKAYARNYYSVELVTYLKQYYEVSSSKEYLEKYADDLKEKAVDALKVQALAEYYGITISEDEVKANFETETANTEDSSSSKTISYEEAVKTYGLPYLMNYYLNNKVTEHISSITITE